MRRSLSSKSQNEANNRRPPRKNGIIKRISMRQNERLQIANDELLDVQRVMEKLFYWAAIIESSDDAIFGKTLEGIITSWNYGAERMYGYRPEEIVGKPVTVLFPEDKNEEFGVIMDHVSQGDAIDHYETRRIRKDGREIIVSVSISPIKNLKGTIIGASSIARDITESKHAVNNFRFLAEASNILSSSLDYKTTLANVAKIAVPQIADWCSVDMLNEEGRLESVAVAHNDPKMIKKARNLQKRFPVDMHTGQGTARVVRTGKSEFYPDVSEEVLRQTAQSEEHFRLMKAIGLSSVIIVPICMEKKCIGTITFVNSRVGKQFSKNDLLMAEELGKRASIATENALLYDSAQKAIVMRDDFISVASHELKTPVTSLKMYSQVLQKYVQQHEDKDLKQFTEKMDKQVDRLTVLINDLLNVSRVQHGKLEFNLDSFDFNELIREIVEHIQPTSPRHKIVVEGSIKNEVYGDWFRLRQVMTNLLSNAIKYSPSADKVVIRLESDKNVAKVAVKDFGIGIDAIHLDKVFDQFYRVKDIDEQTFPGLGLGLYISNEIIKRHNGSMNVESEKGKGTEFSFTIPYA